MLTRCKKLALSRVQLSTSNAIKALTFKLIILFFLFIYVLFVLTHTGLVGMSLLFSELMRSLLNKRGSIIWSCRLQVLHFQSPPRTEWRYNYFCVYIAVERASNVSVVAAVENLEKKFHYFSLLCRNFQK